MSGREIKIEVYVASDHRRKLRQQALSGSIRQPAFVLTRQHGDGAGEADDANLTERGRKARIAGLIETPEILVLAAESTIGEQEQLTGVNG
jgi:hypothetical protein